ncbi:ImmA/IrrE family metallo-endopeptidase [Pseudonocardiaceae bacterium YIM PH 21723]|nr:ImmA/IrrE family metallo-endopeptidase [Pseudonocardiaceae bacterium YIM PH 21723]
MDRGLSLCRASLPVTPRLVERSAFSCPAKDGHRPLPARWPNGSISRRRPETGGGWMRSRHAVPKQLQASCQQRLAEIRIPEPFDINELCARISADRGRPIVLAPMHFAGGSIFGTWLGTDAADYIFYEQRTSTPHQQHIILHELGHIICGHRSDVPIDQGIAGMLFPDCDPQLVRDMLRRGDFSTQQEQEAEIIASLVMEKVSRQPLEPTWATPAQDLAAIARLERLLGGPDRSTR